MQRAITDLGADNAFGRVPAKLKEHYGITVPESAVRAITEKHAQEMTDDDLIPTLRSSVISLPLVAEIDGSMIPIVETATEAKEPVDRRKTRQLSWKEAKLSLIRRSDEITPLVAVTMEEPATAGHQLKRLALAIGLNGATHVHGLGDGAVWIAEQIEAQFGSKGSYLVDFYHLCDYLDAAAPICGPENPKEWMTAQKERLKTGRLTEVVQSLKQHVEDDTVPDDKAPVRCCYRYIRNRPEQFKYQEALAAKLPIGSGEVESAHRYVIQSRLKLAGAWWTKINAQAMLNLRTARHNDCWDRYWNARAA